MKELELKTEKGYFIMFDDAPKGDILVYKGCTYKRLFDLKDATEEQASKIVDKVMNGQHFQNYSFKSFYDRWVKTAIDSLHSLIKSKGFHLFENPYVGNPLTCGASYEVIQEAEEKTFYNPTIYKKCTKE